MRELNLKNYFYDANVEIFCDGPLSASLVYAASP